MACNMKSLLKRTDEILAHDLILLICFPVILGCFIDIALVDFRYLLINIIWMVLFTIPAILLKSSIPNKIAAIIFFLFGTIESIHWILIRGPVTVVSILTVAATNQQESWEFLSMKSSFLLLLIVPYVFLFIYSLRQKRAYSSYRGKHLIILLIAVAAISFILENAINGRMVRKGVPQIIKVSYSFNDQYNFYKQTETGNKARAVEAYPKNEEKQTCVVIIGESLNRNHMSLFSYHRRTTPNLERRDDIFVFKDVVSPYSNTINSVLSLLSASNLENKQKQVESIDLFDIFSSAGFSTFWLSNQPPYGIWENPVTSLAKKADDYKFINIASNSSMEATLTASYDSKLFAPFIDILEMDANKKLIIVHLMGSHSSYKKRYPNQFNLFSGQTEKEKTIAEYDNSVLYNDFIVDSLFKILSSFSTLKNEVMTGIYLSDHGENVYDELDQVGHTYAGELPKANVEIPLIVWLSDAFKKADRNRVLELENNLGKPYVTDDLFHCIIDINRIRTPYFDKSRSLFNENFNDKRKRILEDNRNYDD